MTKTCCGHDDGYYMEYITTLLIDFKKTYGEYVTAFGYINEKNEPVYKLAYPVCKYEGECNMTIEESHLKKLINQIEGRKGLEDYKKAIRNFNVHLEDENKSMIYDNYRKEPEPKYESEVNKKEELLPILKNYLPDEMAERISVCQHKDGKLMIYCNCFNTFYVSFLFQSDKQDLGPLCGEDPLKMNPHFQRYNRCGDCHNQIQRCEKCKACGSNIFKKYNEDELETIKEVLWQVHLLEEGHRCIICKKQETEGKYIKCCRRQSHTDFLKSPKVARMYPARYETAVLICKKCPNRNTCPICKDKLAKK